MFLLRNLFLPVTLFFIWHQSAAQSLPDAFVRAQTGQFQQWLEATSIASYLVADTIVQKDNEIKVFMSINGLKNWQRLDKVMDSAYKHNLSKLLYDRVLFQLDGARCNITIDTRDAYVLIIPEQGRLTTEIRKTLAPSVDFADIVVGAFGGLADTKIFKTNKPIAVVKDKIKMDLKKYFKQFEPVLGKFIFEDISQTDSVLELEVSNIVSCVLEERYFEHITLCFAFHTSAKWTELEYDMKGKYGSGILWAPHEARYNPMVPKYQERVNLFNKTIGSHIYQIVK